MTALHNVMARSTLGANLSMRQTKRVLLECVINGGEKGKVEGDKEILSTRVVRVKSERRGELAGTVWK